MAELGVVIIGCGAPKKSMGWRHLTNITSGKVQGARILAVVEPWFLGAGKDTPAGKSFQAFCAEVSKMHPEIAFIQSMDLLPSLASPTLAVISGRTADMPRLFEEVVGHGATHVYLEKPGAEDSETLEKMYELSEKRGINVVMGYICNISTYVREALAYEADLSKGSGAAPEIEICRVNHYTPENLGECFARNSEGLVRNMLGHDIALAVTFWGIRSDNICTLTVDHDRTLYEERGGFRDFSKLAFAVQTADGKVVKFMGDRCGGDWCGVRVGGEFFKLPADREQPEYKRLRLEEPELMPYFVRMREGYLKLLSASVEHFKAGKHGVPQGAVSLKMGLEVLRVADAIDEMLKSEMRSTHSESHGRVEKSL